MSVCLDCVVFYVRLLAAAVWVSLNPYYCSGMLLIPIPILCSSSFQEEELILSRCCKIFNL